MEDGFNRNVNDFVT
ncbi:hypothetical protein SOVF_173100, partial [Spinacia oleracea]